MGHQECYGYANSHWNNRDMCDGHARSFYGFAVAPVGACACSPVSLSGWRLAAVQAEGGSYVHGAQWEWWFGCREVSLGQADGTSRSSQLDLALIVLVAHVRERGLAPQDLQGRLSC